MYSILLYPKTMQNLVRILFQNSAVKTRSCEISCTWH